MNAPTIVSKGRGLPGFHILHGDIGVGKTAFAAHIPGVIVMQTQREPGLDTLIDAGEVPETPHFDGTTDTWAAIMEQITWLLQGKHDYRAFAIDTIGGAQQLCYDMVCARDYNSDNSTNGFLSYGCGPRTAVHEWKRLLIGLGMLQNERGMEIYALCHTDKVLFKNPEGADYDRYELSMDKLARELTQKQADSVLFYQFHTVVDTEKTSGKKPTKGKALGGQVRFIHTVRNAAYEAKNRYGLPGTIDAGSSGKEAWGNFSQAMTEAKTRKEN